MVCVCVCVSTSFVCDGVCVCLCASGMCCMHEPVM